jgi:hypothetical protein
MIAKWGKDPSIYELESLFFLLKLLPHLPALCCREQAGINADNPNHAFGRQVGVTLPFLGWATARVAPTIYDVAFAVIIVHHRKFELRSYLQYPRISFLTPSLP